MKIIDSLIRRLEISEVQNLDPIRVMLEDIGPGQGRINIECWGKSWASFWGGMGKDTIAEFFTSCDEHYLAGKLSNIPADVYTPDGLKDKLKQEVMDERKKRCISRREARKKFNAIVELDLPETEEQLWGIARKMEELIGEEWWYQIPKTTNPDYAYLTRIIKTVQAGLRELKA